MPALNEQKKLIDRLAEKLSATHGEVGQFETHISRVLVAGDYAFKFKKALRLAFLDFSTLGARRFYCLEEFRLNRRLAPQLYIDVVPITGDGNDPVIGGSGNAIEYAVRMRKFEQQALWQARLAAGLLTADEIDQLATMLVRFHRNADAAAPDSEWGSPHTIFATADENHADLDRLIGAGEGSAQLAELRAWEAAVRSALTPVFIQRKSNRMVRECHGDLHCGNVLTANGEVQVFDCIEFSDGLRWIDVINDLAFIDMDLAFRGRPDLAAHLLNRYLEIGGDHAGLAVLPYYRVHRALVRAKVILLRAQQPQLSADEREACRREGLAYLNHAHRSSQPRRCALMITHGFSGSGKSTFSAHLVPLLGAIRLRSDVERKRLHGLEATDRPASSNSGKLAQPLTDRLYADDATRQTYEYLQQTARAILAAGWPVIIDAACLKRTQRTMFRDLACELSLPFFIFDLQASAATMAARIRARERAGNDASDAGVAVLEMQLRSDEPLTTEEAVHAIAVDMEPPIDAERVRLISAPVLAALDIR